MKRDIAARVAALLRGKAICPACGAESSQHQTLRAGHPTTATQTEREWWYCANKLGHNKQVTRYFTADGRVWYNHQHGWHEVGWKPL